MSSVYALHARKQCPTCKFLTFPLDRATHALNKGTKRIMASATYFAAWVGHTHLKILETMSKPRPHQESFGGKCAWATIFCPTTQFGGVGGPFAGHFFHNFFALLLSALGYVQKCLKKR